MSKIVSNKVINAIEAVIYQRKQFCKVRNKLIERRAAGEKNPKTTNALYVTLEAEMEMEKIALLAKVEFLRQAYEEGHGEVTKWNPNYEKEDRHGQEG